MNRLIISCQLTLCGMLLAQSSWADAAKTRKALTANYNAISAAFKKQNVKAMGQFMTDDFAAVRADGTSTNRQQILSDFDRQVKSMKNPNWVRTIDSLEEKGNDAIVTVLGKMSGTVTDPQGKTHKMQFNATAKDTWTKVGKDWKLKKSQLLKGVMSIDGKEMPAR